MRAKLNGRGVHPKMRASTIRFWTFDDADDPEVREVVGSTLDLDAFGIATTPERMASPVGTRARRFNRGVTTDVLATGDASADSAVLQVEWTAGIWVRVRALPGAGSSTIWALGGTASDETEAFNLQGSLTIDSVGNFGVEWEEGAGVDVAASFATYDVPLNRWLYVQLRKEDQGAGQASVDLIVNGAVLETTPNLTTNTGGSDASTAWSFGARVNGTTAAGAAEVDVASFMISNVLQPIAECKDDFRRGRMLGFWTHIDIKVEAEDALGARRDLTNLEGVDFVDTVSISDSIDNAVKTGNIGLTRDVRELGLALLNTASKANLTNPASVTSYDPLLDVARTVEVFAARVPLGVRARGTDWQSLLRGPTDVTDAGGNAAQKIEVRDEGARFIDTYAEEEVMNPGIVADAPPEKQPSYGSLSGDDLENVIQDILNDNDNDPGNNTVTGLVARAGSYDPVSLYTPVTPAWALLPYRQKLDPVMTAIRNLAGQIGWEARYKYFQGDTPDADDWRFTLFDVARERIDHDIILTEREVQEYSRVAIDVKQIRNVVRIVYPSSETVLPVPVNPDPSRYIQRSGWVGLDGGGNRMPAYYELEDFLSTARHGRRYMGIGEVNSSEIDTIIEAQQYCLGIISDLADPTLEHSVSAEMLFEIELADMVLFEPVKELYSVQQRLAVVGHSMTFGDKASCNIELRGKPAVGFQRWLRLETRPGQGRPAVADPRRALTDSEKGPLLRVIRNLLDQTSQLAGGKYLAIQNPNFQGWSAGDQNPPDGWEVGDGGVWGTDFEEDKSILASGGHSVRLLTEDGRLQTNFIQVDGTDDTPYTIEVSYQQDTGAPDSSPFIQLRWYDKDFVELVLNGEGRSAHKAEAPVEIDTVQRIANIGMITTKAAHGYSTGDVVSVRPASMVAAGFNQEFRKEKVAITVTGATTFSYSSPGVDRAATTDQGPEGAAVGGSVVLRPRRKVFAVPATIGKFYVRREQGAEPPNETARYLRVEFGRVGSSEVLVDRISVYKGARETTLTPRTQYGVLGVNAWTFNPFRGDNGNWGAGRDVGRNWASPIPTLTALQGGNTVFLAREDMRVRVFSRVTLVEAGGTIVSARLRVVQNETYNNAGVPDAVGTVEVVGGKSTPGGAGVTAGQVIVSVEGEIQLAEGDTLSLEVYIERSVVGGINYDTTTGASFFLIKQEDLD